MCRYSGGNVHKYKLADLQCKRCLHSCSYVNSARRGHLQRLTIFLLVSGLINLNYSSVQ